jgi:hypothetical protein
MVPVAALPGSALVLVQLVATRPVLVQLDLPAQTVARVQKVSTLGTYVPWSVTMQVQHQARGRSFVTSLAAVGTLQTTI